jgi:hypothetical protein
MAWVLRWHVSQQLNGRWAGVVSCWQLEGRAQRGRIIVAISRHRGVCLEPAASQDRFLALMIVK